MKKLILFFASFAALFTVQTTQAYQSLVTHAQDGRELFNFYIADKNEKFGEWDTSFSQWNPEHSDSLQYASDYWASLLGDLPKNLQAAKISIGTNDMPGCGAMFGYGENGNGQTHLVNAVLHNSDEYFRKDFYAQISIGKPMSGKDSYYTGQIKLQSDHQHMPLATIFVHEIGHSMGISAAVVYDIKRDDKYEFFFNSKPITNFSKHLFDSFGKNAVLNMEIV